MKESQVHRATAWYIILPSMDKKKKKKGAGRRRGRRRGKRMRRKEKQKGIADLDSSRPPRVRLVQ